MKTLFFAWVCPFFLITAAMTGAVADSGVLAIADSRSPGTVKVIDDAIFESKKPEPTGDMTESAAGTKRYKGNDANYTTDQQGEWAQKCSINNELGSPSYRDCYRKERTGAAANVRSNRNSVEKRMGASKGPPVPITPSNISPGAPDQTSSDTRKLDSVFQETGE